MIIADANERTEHEFETGSLSVGDYAVEGARGKYLIERKELNDFVDSFRSGQLFSQLSRMAEQEHRTMLIIEGDNIAPQKSVTPGEIRRYKTSVAVKWDVLILESDTEHETIKIIEDVDDWLGDDGRTSHSVRPTAKVSAEDRPAYLVEGLPGIGPKTSARLLDHFATALDVFTASEDELQEVDGIGRTTAENIRDALNREPA